MTRLELKQESNNKQNPNQNICANAVAKALNVAHLVRYIHTMEDIVRAARKSYMVRSRKSRVKGKTVGAIRKQLKAIGANHYLVRVDNHVLLLDNEGNTLVDTNPRLRDKRKITHVYGVYAVK